MIVWSLTVAICHVSLIGESAHRSWVVCYSEQAPIETLASFDLVVLDGQVHPPLEPLLERGRTVLGYLSLGEVASYRSHYDSVRSQGILLERNRHWPDSFMVDLRSPLWTERVLEDLIPEILHEGFHGLFLDTLDNAAFLEDRDPEKYGGMTSAAVRLVRTIRRHYPSLPIMMNRGYEILPRVADKIDLFLAESLYSDYDFDTGTYKPVSVETYEEQVGILRSIRKRWPDLQIFTLDYWDPGDPSGLAEVYARQRSSGFIPYVSTIALDRVITEPVPR